jgi:pilus assembly protein FimV
LLSSEVWAIGLGDINLDSALNEPLRAEIELLSVTPEELANLTVTLASAETFSRYGIDRPLFLQDIEFNVLANGPNGAVVQIGSRSPITEPFVTFLVEATWSSGRLLREYTVLLDPPTYAPPAVQQAPAVEAPRRATTTDSARIERQQPVQQQTQRPTPPPAQPRVTPPPTQARDRDPAPVAPAPAESSYSTASAGDYYVERGDTLWGIASRMRADSRLTMNQTMLAIFEANPGAFSNNINRLSAGASLRIPSADEVFQISRGDAFSEVKRQNAVWRETTGVPSPDAGYADADTGYTDPATDYTDPVDTAETRPSLELVPPDEEPAGIDYDDDLATSDTQTREQEIEDRIVYLESADVPEQQSLIVIRDNELATLRQELADIRGETYETPADDELFVDDELIDDSVEMADDDLAADDEASEPEPVPVVRTRASEPSVVDRIIGWLTSIWAMIAAALVAVAGLLFWFVRRGSDEDDDSSLWETLDKDELAAGAMAATETLRAPTHDDESIVVVEQDSGIRPLDDDTIEAPTPEAAEAAGDTGEFGSLEDTFSSETAVNLDQTDPLAEADFHMAYGLYDQAADLVNGALEADPTDQALMSKLCEIYFVWGNQDAFIDAATRLNAALGDSESADWDKIVIMGQQIAADHELFAGAGVAGATKAVDLSFEAEMDDAAELDMDFGDDGAAASDIIDLGAADAAGEDGGVDFLFEADEASADPKLEDTEESPTIDSSVDLNVTAEMPAPVEATVESPTIEQQFQGMDGTSELPSLDESLGDAISDSGQDADETAEINLDELDLEVTGTNEALDDTGINEALSELGDLGDATGKNPEIDTDATGVGEALKLDDLQDLGDADSTGMRLAPDETGASPMLHVEDATDTSLDVDLLDATGHTQVLSEDFAVETQSDVDTDLGDEDATMLAPMDEDEDDFDFAKTEALPPEAFTGNTSLDETGEMPAVARTDVDLDLDDLTAALAVSEIGDTVEQLRDDATVEQPRPTLPEETAEVPTMSIAPEDMSDDLHDARTMTEVGTKLDLARAYVDMGDPAGARGILEEVLDEGDEGQKQQAQQLLDSLPS